MSTSCIRIALFSALFYSQLVSAQSLLERSKTTIDMAACLLANTETMCLVEALAKNQPSIAVDERTTVYGQSGEYYLVTTSADWIRLWPEVERKEDLVLAEKNGKALIEVNWEKGKVGQFETVARKPLEPMLEKLNAEPTRIEADYWPYQEDGVIYRLCYNTNKKTSECVISAAANLPGGFITFYSLSNMDESTLSSVTEIIASLDVAD